MRKKLFYIQWRLLLLCLLALTVVACSDSGDDTAPTPTNNTSEPIEIMVGTAVTLQAADPATTDSTNINSVLYLEIVWTIVSKPPNSQATIENPNSATPTFRPDIIGEYVLRVVITQNGNVLADNEIAIVAGVDDLFPTKPVTHLLSTDICEACHYDPNIWALVNVDHNQVIGVCSSCHDGVTYTGKSPNHIATELECDACHTTVAWINSNTGGVDHTGFAGNCISCHDGVTASGKSVSHIESSNQCDACHTLAPTPWVPVAPSAVDHNQVIGTCVSCHNGMIATGKGPTHIPSADTCDSCHVVSAWITVGSTIDHTQVIGTCESCHDGIMASGKSPTHVETTLDCLQCHTTNAWLPATN